MYRSILAVDGQEVGRAVVDDNAGHCGDVEPSNADAHEFDGPQSCPLHAAGEVAFDTSALPDGRHTVTLSVEDVAGNVTRLHEGSIQTHNAPISTAAPLLSGEARVGAALGATLGQWDGAPTGFDRHWLRCDAAGEACVAIAGAADATYLPVAADAYHRIVAEVVAENGSGTASAHSIPSAPVADAAGRTTPPSDGPPAPGGDDDGDDHGSDGGSDDTNGGGRVDSDGDGGARSAGGGATDRAGTGAGGTAPGIPNPLADQGGHAANGTNASAHSRIVVALRRPGGSSATRVRSPYGRRWTIVGRIRDEHDRPIAGARLNLVWRVAGRRPWQAHGIVRSGADGRISATLPKGASRTVRLTYFAFADSREPRSSNQLTVDVAAPLTIAVDRAHVSGSRVVVLSGAVKARPIPAAGVLVTLQGFQPGYGWRTFRTVRAARNGHWRSRYRFRSSSGRFAFRAIVPRQSGYPFVTSSSKRVAVTVS